MRVYSASQGKFIDVPDQGASPQQTGGQAFNSTQSSIEDTGSGPSPLDIQFAKLIANNPKQVTSLEAIYKHLKGPEPTKATAEMRNRKEALKPAHSAVNRIDDKLLSKLGPQNKIAELSLRHLGGLGVDSNTKDLDTKFSLMRQNVVRALQGARMSDKDIELASGFIPSISDTPEYARIKLKNLKQFISDIEGNQLDTSNLPTPEQSQSNSQWEWGQ